MSLRKSPDALKERAAATHFYEDMEKVLGGQEFLCDAYSYADIAFYMAHVFRARMGVPITDATPNLRSWRDRMTNRPAVQAVLGPMCTFLSTRGRPVPDFISRATPQRA